MHNDQLHVINNSYIILYNTLREIHKYYTFIQHSNLSIYNLNYYKMCNKNNCYNSQDNT